MSHAADLPHVVIVGCGFAGLAAARGLAAAPCRVTVIDRRNHHLFQPLLYQVATAALSPADIAWPIRALLARQANAEVQLGRVTGVDPEDRSVLPEGGRRVAYDRLVLATGARHSCCGQNAWEAVAPGLKKIDDATLIRQRVLLAFERAELEPHPTERSALLTFVVVGGGPTGVEMAGAIAELARYALAADFRPIDTRAARTVLLEAGPRLLPSFPPELSEAAAATLRRLGVEVRLGRPVTGCDEQGVVVDGQRIPTRTIVWGAVSSPRPPGAGSAYPATGPGG